MMLRAKMPIGGRLALRRFFAAVATVPKANVPAAGARFVVEEDKDGNALADPILVAKVDGAFFAIDATCPHMNKSMEKGKILENNGDAPQIQCPLHNSRFDMKTGACIQWVTGVLGFESKMVSGVARKVGGEKRDIKAYRVIENDDGTLTIDDGLSSN